MEKVSAFSMRLGHLEVLRPSWSEWAYRRCSQTCESCNVPERTKKADSIYGYLEKT